MGSILPLAARQFPEEPLQSIRPIDEVEVADPDQGTFVVAPLT